MGWWPLSPGEPAFGLLERWTSGTMTPTRCRGGRHAHSRLGGLGLAVVPPRPPARARRPRSDSAAHSKCLADAADVREAVADVARAELCHDLKSAAPAQLASEQFAHLQELIGRPVPTFRTWSSNRPAVASPNMSSWEPGWTPSPSAGRRSPPGFGWSRSTGLVPKPGSVNA
jgi:hypothetical protein